ncbi:MAG TPA: hypothetical protein VM695_12785 [Phycisphaerae bacterium]|nr:hypothetical protein [Phycisphaerae bacterium]
MQSIRETLFEDPFYLYVIFAVGGVVCLGMWRARRQAKWLLATALMALLAGGAWTLARYVVTGREQVLAVMDTMAEAAQRHDAEALIRHVDDHYRGWGLRKLGLYAAVKTAMVARNIQKVSFLGRPNVEVTGDRADSTVRIVVLYGGEGDAVGRYPMAWKVEWIRRPDGWKVQHATQLDNPLP